MLFILGCRTGSKDNVYLKVVEHFTYIWVYHSYIPELMKNE